jgi:cytochrome c oxidase cbb3-type subunit 2
MARRTRALPFVCVLAALGFAAVLFFRRTGERGGNFPAAPPDNPAGDERAEAPAWDPSSVIAASPELLQEGKAVYEKQCAPCHGSDGAGAGPAAYLLYPKPRDFVAASYRLVSTWDGVATDADLFRTISRGIPGSAMPSWYHLPERTRWALVHTIKGFASRPFEIASPTAESPQAGVVQVPPEVAETEDGRRRAAELFAKGCASCHGAAGKGDGQEKQIDNEGYPTRPRDLTAGIFKGSPAPEHLFRRMVAGMPGSPMPSSGFLADGTAGWDMVHFILAMSSPAQRQRSEMRRFRIAAPKVPQLPRHPDDGAWRAAPSVHLHLMPLWWRFQRPEELTVQALHDGRELALLLSWADDTHDHTAIRPQDFRDAVAVELALAPDPPFFAMGEAGRFVNLWMWKSERQSDLEPAFQDLEKVYPRLGIDAYPNLALSPLEQPARHALTLESDPTFVTGWGAGNIVSDPTRKSAVEDLASQGFGTLSARPRPDQQVEGSGVYATGTYRVQLRRTLKASGERAASFRPGSTVPVAFAVWNGSAGDRDGKKSVTIWQDLVLEP